MHRWPLMMLCFIFAALTAQAVVHAAERPGAAAIECSGYTHSDNDGDQSPGDADTKAPHHHGACHATSAVIADRTATPVKTAPVRSLVDRSTSPRLARWTSAPALRPPIA